MRSVLLLAIVLLLSLQVKSQTPELLTYETVINNSTGTLVANRLVSLRVSILQGSASGSVVYSETHNVTTNYNGLAKVAIGGGNPVSGSFGAINWGSNSYYLKTEVDISGGSNYTTVSTNQFLSASYSLYSKTAATAVSSGNGYPAGAIAAFAGSAAPTGWLVCDGSAVSRSNYADLFSSIGTIWGPGDGSTTFNLPDLRGRSMIGSGQGAGLTSRTLGSNGGEETHTLTISEIPSHSHDIPRDNGGSNYTWGLPNVPNAGAPTSPTATSGGGQAHNNMQPFAVVQYIIKY